jgi:hypothetical protein
MILQRNVKHRTLSILLHSDDSLTVQHDVNSKNSISVDAAVVSFSSAQAHRRREVGDDEQAKFFEIPRVYVLR